MVVMVVSLMLLDAFQIFNQNFQLENTKRDLVLLSFFKIMSSITTHVRNACNALFTIFGSF